MQLISTVTVGAGGAANIELTNIPQTFTDLQIILSARTTTSGTIGGYLTFNANFGTIYSDRRLTGTGSSVGSTSISGASASTYYYLNDSGTTANSFSNTQFYFPNYAGSTNKSVSIDNVSENNASTAYQSLQATLFSSTSPISYLLLTLTAGNFAQYSTASLYGITKGSGGATVA